METTLNILFCKPLSEQHKAKIFLMLLTVISVITICQGNHASASARTILPLMSETLPHCVLHREALISKSLVPELQKLLDETDDQNGSLFSNYIKSRPLMPMLLSATCSAMVAAITQLLLQSGVRWLSRRLMLSRFYELREEHLFFFSRLKSLSWLTCLVMRPGAIKMHPSTNMASFWLSLRQSTPSSQRRRLKHSFPFQHRICVRLASLL